MISVLNGLERKMGDFNIITFSEFREDLRPECGNKASNLAVLYQAGFNVPNGFIIPVSVLFEADASSSLTDKLISTFNLLEPPVVVRSSAVNEDSVGRSYAGVFSSVLNVVSIEDYINALKKVCASSKSERVNNYVGEGEQKMAIIVQSFVKAEHSGILFTVNPVNGNKSEMVIEYFNGLGPAIVGGKTTPQHLVITKTDNKIKESVISRNGIACYANENGGYREVNISGDRVTYINEPVISKLTEEAKRIEDFFGCPQDVEWTIVGDKVFILQSRPITA